MHFTFTEICWFKLEHVYLLIYWLIDWLFIEWGTYCIRYYSIILFLTQFFTYPNNNTEDVFGEVHPKIKYLQVWQLNTQGFVHWCEPEASIRLNAVLVECGTRPRKPHVLLWPPQAMVWPVDGNIWNEITNGKCFNCDTPIIWKMVHLSNLCDTDINMYVCTMRTNFTLVTEESLSTTYTGD